VLLCVCVCVCVCVGVCVCVYVPARHGTGAIQTFRKSEPMMFLQDARQCSVGLCTSKA